jgi:hypothetical protein
MPYETQSSQIIKSSHHRISKLSNYQIPIVLATKTDSPSNSPAKSPDVNFFYTFPPPMTQKLFTKSRMKVALDCPTKLWYMLLRQGLSQRTLMLDYQFNIIYTSPNVFVTFFAGKGKKVAKNLIYSSL